LVLLFAGLIYAQVVQINYGINQYNVPVTNQLYTQYYQISLQTTPGSTVSTFLTLAGIYIPPDTQFLASFNFTQLQTGVGQFPFYARSSEDYEIWILAQPVQNPLYISVSFNATQTVTYYIDAEIGNKLSSFVVGPQSASYISATVTDFQKYWIEIPIDVTLTQRYFYVELCSAFTPPDDAITDYYFTLYWDQNAGFDGLDPSCAETAQTVITVDNLPSVNYRRNLCPARAFLDVSNYTGQSHFGHVWYAPLDPAGSQKNVIIWSWDDSQYNDIELPTDMSLRGARLTDDLVVTYNAINYPYVTYTLYTDISDQFFFETTPTSACFAAKNLSLFINQTAASQANSGVILFPNYFTLETATQNVYLIATFANSTFNANNAIKVTYSGLSTTALNVAYNYTIVKETPFWVTSSTIVAAVLGGLVVVLLIVVIYLASRSAHLGYEAVKS